MEIIVLGSEKDVAYKAADLVEEAMRNNPTAVLGLATGSSPLGLYRELIRRNRDEDLDFSKITTVNLDEYAGLSPEHHQSYHYFMKTNLFDYININPNNTHVPEGNAEDLQKEAERYEDMLMSMEPQDIQVLGIGTNGHIAFNEPSQSLSDVTHTVSLTDDTIESNARFFEGKEDVPRSAITMGMRGIMRAKKIVLIALGKSKAEAVGKFRDNEITTMNPSSLLKLHADVTVICDSEAGSMLENSEK